MKNEKEYIAIRLQLKEKHIVIIEQEAEIMEANMYKTTGEIVALEYRRQLLKIFKHIDHRISEIENIDTIDEIKKRTLLKELKRLKFRFNP